MSPQQPVVFLVLILTLSQRILRTSSEYCMCVPFWQCRDEDSDLYDDLSEMVDPRDSGSSNCLGTFDVCCRVQCGLRGTTSVRLEGSEEDIVQPRILGQENESKFGEYPWMLGILHQDDYRCGASLIHPKVALTAAHCVQDKGTYTVRAGEMNWSHVKEALPHQDRVVKTVITHAQYHPASLRNDISLLIVKEPFELSDNVGVVCLPHHNIYTQSSECIATGWGKNSYYSDHYEQVLKEVALPLVQRSRCEKALRKARLGPRFVLHRSFICAGGKKNKDTCKGDGGSPLICPVKGDGERYEQVGIVSWGLTCGLPDIPGVYVNVALFTRWIDQQMKKHKLDNRIYKL